MRTKQTFGMVGSVILCLLLIIAVFKPYLAGKAGEMKLLQATKEGDIETIKVLLDSGTEVNAKDKDGYAALMRAAGGPCRGCSTAPPGRGGGECKK